MKKDIFLFDTTLRDGTQAEGISLSIENKLKITKRLDEFGIDFIEGGWPGSNPKDYEYFRRLKKIKLKHAEPVAFGSTRRKDIKPADDGNLKAIVSSGVRYACIFGKTWDLHVIHALKTSLEENLRMISDSVSFLVSRKINVIYDAEHFFDGYKNNREYALKTVAKAQEAGAKWITLCDTNGGTIPSEIEKIVRDLNKYVKIPLGIHTHNDADLAVANSVIAVENGINLVQGTMNGYGERCGNANLVSIIPVLEIKLGKRCLPPSNLKKLTELSRYIDDIINMIPRNNQPFVGMSAFAHKGGIHVSAMERNRKTYEHISPETVGNTRRIILSELSGKSNIRLKTNELNLALKDDNSVDELLKLTKKQEEKGYQYEGADASFDILVRKHLKKYSPFFELLGFRVTNEKDEKGELNTEATIKVRVGGKVEHTAAEGDGPVNALDNALRKALEKFYPVLKEVKLTDFKVRVINAEEGTAARVRVYIEMKDHKKEWNTIGVSTNLIEASWQALVDALEYKLVHR